MKKKLLLGIFVFGIILFALVFKTQSINALLSSDNQKKDQLNLALSSTSHKLLDLSLIQHGPIEILNDDDFIDYGFSGSGTAGEPYIIENYDITTTNLKGIYINGTTKHFVIRNCYVDAHYSGIYISKVAEGTASIINNTVKNNEEYGIFLVNSANSTLNNNTCSNNKYGIYLHFSSDATLTNNTCSINKWNGIFLDSSSSATLMENTCSNNKMYGIYLVSSSGAILTNNTCNNNEYNGIKQSSSSGTTLTNNTCNNNNYGIELINSANSTLDNNTCSNNIWYGIRLDSSSGAILTNNTFSSNKEYGIHLLYSSHSTLESNKFYNDGLLISEVSIEDYLTYTVENNWVNDKLLGFYINRNKVIISDPIFGQLIFINCNEIVVSNQELTNTSIGLYLRWCENANISNNTCSNNRYGIYLDSSSSGATLTENTCSNNEFHGIYLSSSSGATLTNNTCSNNNDHGIRLYGSSDSCLITYNLLQENSEYGIFLEVGSDNNIIHHNTFIDNYLGGSSQAYDEGTNNTWYDSIIQEGNYWNDWNEKEPYLIDGNSNATDPYPLNENLERIDFEYTLVIPALILVAILLKRKRNTYFRP